MRRSARRAGGGEEASVGDVEEVGEFAKRKLVFGAGGQMWLLGKRRFNQSFVCALVIGFTLYLILSRPNLSNYMYGNFKKNMKV